MHRFFILVPGVAVAMTVLALAPSMVAQDPGVEAKGFLYFNAESPEFQGTITTLLCGQKSLYDLADAVPPETRAHLGRAVLELLSCSTDFNFVVTQGFTVTGPVEVNFPLGCEIIGVIQSSELLGLESVKVTILKNDAEMVSGIHYVTSGHVGICQSTTPFMIGVITDDVGEQGVFEVDDVLTCRIQIKAINTEAAVLPYWYLRTGGDANISAVGRNLRPPGPPPTTPTETTNTTTTNTTTPTTNTTTPTETTTPTGTTTTPTDNTTSPTETTSPTPTTPIPFFPSNTAIVVGALGALGGAFVVLRRRP